MRRPPAISTLLTTALLAFFSGSASAQNFMDDTESLTTNVVYRALVDFDLDDFLATLKTEQDIAKGIKTAQMQGHIGDWIKAIAIYEHLMKIEPGHPLLRLQLGTAYAQVGYDRKAQVLLEDLLDEIPGQIALVNNLAWLYATAEDLSVRDGERAKRMAQEALLAAPESYSIWSTLAEAYFVLAEYEKAEKAVLQAIQIGVQQNISQPKLQRFYKQLNKCRQGVETRKLLPE